MEEKHKTAIRSNKSLLTDNVRLEDIEPFLKESKIFTNAMLQDIYNSDCDLFDELLTRGPEAFYLFVRVLSQAGLSNVGTSLMDEVQNTHFNISPKLPFYKMSSSPLGYCLIINNEEFKNPIKNRIGSTVDFIGLRHLFEEIGYTVFPEENLSADKMKKCLKTFSKKDFGCVDSSIVIILSHGDMLHDEDSIEGVKGNFIAKREIYEMFAKSEKLQNKPKLFIFQACRGKEEMYGDSTDAAPRSAFRSERNIVVSRSDMLIVHATLPDHVAYRNARKGAYLCQELIKVFREDFHTTDVKTMLDKVSRRVDSMRTLEAKTQVPNVELNLRALLYFDTRHFSESDISKLQYVASLPSNA